MARGHIPLRVLQRRHDRLERIIERRAGKRAKAGQIPLDVLVKRQARLDRIIAKRS